MRIKVLYTLLFYANLLLSQTPVHQWSKSIGYGSGAPFGGYVGGNFVETDGFGNMYVCGDFVGTVDLDPGTARFTLGAAGAEDVFLARYNAGGNLAWAFRLGGVQSDHVTAMEMDPLGNIYITGFYAAVVDFDPSPAKAILDAGNYRNIFFAKYSSSGNLVWVKNLTNTGMGTPWSSGVDIQFDNSRNVFLCGYFQMTVDFDPSPGTATLNAMAVFDDFIAKYDSLGNYVWAKQFAFSNSNSSCREIDVLPSGDVIVAGEFFGQNEDFDPSASTTTLSSSGGGMYFAKFSTTGNFVWVKQFGLGSGGAVSDLAIDTAGNIYLSGVYMPGWAYIAKYDLNGNSTWIRNNIGNGAWTANCNQLLINSASGDIYVAGEFTGTGDFDPSAATANLTGQGGVDILVARYSSSGDYAWAKSFGGGSPDAGYDLAFRPNNRIVVTGMFNCTVDFDPSAQTNNVVSDGASMFLATYDRSNGAYDSAFAAEGSLGGNDFIKDMTKDASGNVIVAGFFEGKVDFDPSPAYQIKTATGITCHTPGHDIFFGKYSSQGNLMWVQTIGGTGMETIGEVETDISGNTYIAGTFSGTADFDPSGAVATLTAFTNNYDSYIAKYDTQGNYLWALNFGGPSNSPFTDMKVANNTIYVTGFLQGVLDFDPSPGTATLSPSGGANAFIAAYDLGGNYLWAKKTVTGGPAFSYGLAIDNSGAIYITGNFAFTCDFDPSAGTANLTEQNGNGDGFIARYDATGNYLWARSFSGPGAESGQILEPDAAGNIILLAQFQYTTAFTSPSNTVTLSANPPYQWFNALGKYDASGNLLWVGSLGNISTRAMTRDSLENILLTGGFGGTNDFDPSGAVSNVTSVGSSDMYVAKYTPAGNFLSATAMGGSGGASPEAAFITKQGDLYVGGGYRDTIDFDPGVSSAVMSSYKGSPYTYDAFLARYHACNFPPANTQNITGNVLNCTGTSTSYSLGNISGASSYSWNFPSGWVGSGSTNISTVTVGSSGTIFAYAINPCGVSNAATLTVNSYASPVMTVSTSQNTYCVNETFTLSGSGSNGNYSWTGPASFAVPDSTAIVTATSTAQSGNYILGGANNYGVITCQGKPDTINIQIDACLGLEKDALAPDLISLLPNPCDGVFAIRALIATPKLSFEVLNSAGQIVIASQSLAANREINLRTFPPGVYFVKVAGENKPPVTKKLIIANHD